MLTTKEAAELLGITPRRVQELIKNGALEARKASGVWLIDKDSVDTRLRSVTKTGGRPRRGYGKSEIAFTLMNRTYEVAQLVYNTSGYLALIAPYRSTLSALGGAAAVSRSHALG